MSEKAGKEKKNRHEQIARRKRAGGKKKPLVWAVRTENAEASSAGGLKRGTIRLFGPVDT
jgi:hypothetical protein